MLYDRHARHRAHRSAEGTRPFNAAVYKLYTVGRYLTLRIQTQDPNYCQSATRLRDCLYSVQAHPTPTTPASGLGRIQRQPPPQAAWGADPTCLFHLDILMLLRASYHVYLAHHILAQSIELHRVELPEDCSGRLTHALLVVEPCSQSRRVDRKRRRLEL